jgi:hypothetical protein
MKTTFCFLFCILAFIIEGCTPLTLRPADFSWPIEIVAAPDSSGSIQVPRYEIAFNSKPLMSPNIRCMSYATRTGTTS